MNDTTLPKKVRVVEVGPREGLQNEQNTNSTDDKAVPTRVKCRLRRWSRSPSDCSTSASKRSVSATLSASPRRAPEPVLAILSTSRLGLHFHDTRGTALANTLRALQLGCHIFDSSAGGLGGRPDAPGASGNLATEDLLYLLHDMDIQTGVSLEAVMTASRFIAERLGRPPTSKVYQVELASAARAGH